MCRGCGRSMVGRSRSKGWWKCDGGVVVGLYRKEYMDECTNLTPEALRNLTSLHFTLPFIPPKTSQPTNPYNPARALPLNRKRSYSLAVVTQRDLSQLYTTSEARFSYPGRRAQPPADTTEWWEIIDLFAQGVEGSIPVCFFVVVVFLLCIALPETRTCWKSSRV
jgi:hypothetical protein